MCNIYIPASFELLTLKNINKNKNLTIILYNKKKSTFKYYLFFLDFFFPLFKK